MLDDVSLFVQIVRAAGLAAAGEKLGLPAATVTRRLARLERRLGCKLIHRSARRFDLTREGQAYYEALAHQIEAVETVLEGLGREMHQISGPLRVAAPSNISLRLMAGMWTAFAQAHPQIRLDLRLSNDRVDLEHDGIELAVRIGPQPDSGYHQTRIGVIRTVLVASPDYLDQRGRPAHPTDLRAHDIVGVKVLPTYALRETAGDGALRLDMGARLAVDDTAMALNFVSAGLGLALVPVSEVAEGLATGRLERVLPGWQGPDRDVFAVWPSGRLLSLRARTLKTYLEDFARSEPILRGEVPGPFGVSG